MKAEKAGQRAEDEGECNASNEAQAPFQKQDGSKSDNTPNNRKKQLR